MKHLHLYLTVLILVLSFCLPGQIPQTMSYQGLLTDNNGVKVADGDYTIEFNLYNTQTSGSSLWTETQTVTITDGIFNVILGKSNPLMLQFDEAYWLGIAIDSGTELVPRIELTSSAYSMKAMAVQDSSISAASIQKGQIVRSINNLKDDLILHGGDNISVSQNQDSLIISATGLANGDITSVTAGMGLQGGGTEGDIALSVLAGTGIEQGDSVRLDLFYTDSRYVEEGQSNAVTTNMINDGAISDAKLAGDAVTESKIADNAVTAAKINPDIVSTIDGVSNDAGDIDFVAGSNMSIVADDAANTITFSSSGGTGGGDITAVNAGSGLTGGGTVGDVTLNADFAGNGAATTIARSDHNHDATYVNESQANSITSNMIVDGTVDEVDLADNAVTAAKISTDVISSIDGVSNDAGDVDLVAGSNITITPDDANNQITFSASASNLWNQSGSDIYYNTGNVGIGSSSTAYPLNIVPGTNERGINIDHNQTGTSSAHGIFVSTDRTGTGNGDAVGVYSIATNADGNYSTYGLHGAAGGAATGPKIGVYGMASGSGSVYGLRGWVNPSAGTTYGVQGIAQGTGILNQYGVYGAAQGTGTGNHYGVYGTASGGGSNHWAGYFDGIMYADSVGIGTTAPEYPLSVAGTIHSGSGGFRFPDGTTQTTAAVSASGNTLDEAYDEGGPGAGRTITADSGAVTINGEYGFLSTGTFGSGTIPVEGAGTRLMWYPNKAAFRAGYAANEHWNDSYIGDYSVAMGRSTVASSYGSTALGVTAVASGDYSTAVGHVTEAIGNSSTSMGYATDAIGDYSTAMGYYSNSGGYASTAMGLNTVASGDYSTAIGSYTTASGDFTTAIGREIEANGEYSIAIALNDQNGTVVSQNNTMAIMGGRVGIGTASPSAGLHLNATGFPNSFMFIEGASGNDAGLRLYEDTTPKWHIFNNAASDALQIYNTGAASTVFFAEQATGFVGIGRTNPNWRLHVETNSSSAVAMFENDNQGTNSDGIIIKAGRILNPSYDVDFVSFQDGNGDRIGQIDGNDAGGVRYVTTSDARLKTNIRDFQGGLNKVSQIQVRNYEMKSAPGKERNGLIAQELQKIYPEAVSGIPDSDVEKDPMMIDYGRITPVIVSAIQELKTEKDEEIAELKAIIAELQNKIEQLENK